MGLVDGTHIPVLPAADGYKDFVNRKGWPSYLLQGVVDDKGCCKMPGSAHDATVLRQSELFQKAHLLPKGVKNIEREEVRLLVVGDPACPLLDWIIKGTGCPVSGEHFGCQGMDDVVGDGNIGIVQFLPG
ncbi:hypothetical protein AOLI_G00093550 [Acnodon oligacanthus]